MPQLRERNKIAPKKKIVESSFNAKWTLAEKKKLLIALRKHRPESLDVIRSEYLPHRSEKEISWFLERMKKKGRRKPDASRPRAPIELWESMAEQLTRHDVDYSYCLAEVFKKIADEEFHFPKNVPENPDWKMIYTYLVALLRGDDPPDVGQIEAAVLLDLTEALAEHLKSLDTSAQRLLMTKKYDLLAARVNAKSCEESMVLTKRALEEDPTESNGESCPGLTPSNTSSSASAVISAAKFPDESTSQQGSQGTSTMDETSADAIQPSTTSGETDVTSTGRGSGPSTSISQSTRPYGLHPTGSKRGRKKKTLAPIPTVLSSLQKTALYSINPFCIPIKYLNPKPSRPVPAAARVTQPYRAGPGFHAGSAFRAASAAASLRTASAAASLRTASAAASLRAASAAAATPAARASPAATSFCRIILPSSVASPVVDTTADVLETPCSAETATPVLVAPAPIITISPSMEDPAATKTCTITEAPIVASSDVAAEAPVPNTATPRTAQITVVTPAGSRMATPSPSPSSSSTKSFVIIFSGSKSDD